jgi:hypothetical protein
MKPFGLSLLILALVAGIVLAQRGFRGGYGGRGYRRAYLEEYRTPRQITQHGNETPTWTNAPGFEQDVFTFVRMKRGRAPYSYGGSWDTDTPDSDLNLSYRLQQVTSLKVDPDGLFLRLTDEELADYPFIYMVEPGSLFLSTEEATTLRTYLLNGGFLMLDDFWGPEEWGRFWDSMQMVFPDREVVEIADADAIFHGVYDLKDRYQIHGRWAFGGGWMRQRIEGTRDEWRGIYDDKNRLMVAMCFNSDVGDSWEWADDPTYPEKYSALGIRIGVNYVVYSLTH